MTRDRTAPAAQRDRRTEQPAPHGESAPSTAAGAWVHEPIPSELLLCGCNLLEINHKGTIYRLRVTRQDKLILTK